MTRHYAVLDGWRAISICLVLAGHLLPLGPSSWGLNVTFAATGMAIFFILSGFLITNQLLDNQSVISFLIRRFARILPLAWLTIALSLLWWGSNTDVWLANLFFYANWEPMRTTSELSHFWSLCVEMQFYVSVAFLVALLGRKGLWVLPLLAISVTMFKLSNGVGAAINTYYRVDEILAGCILALANERLNLNHIRVVKTLSKPVFSLFALSLVFLSCHSLLGDHLRYITGYIAMIAVGSTLVQSGEKNTLVSLLESKFLNYIAQISFALYVTHGVARHTWLGSGDTLEKYLKRPLLFGVVFAASHLSTFHFERYWTNLGRKACRALMAAKLSP